MLLFVLGSLLIIAIWMGSYRNKAKEGLEEPKTSYPKIAGIGFKTPASATSLPTKTVEECETACNTDPQCAGFTHMPDIGCELKSSMDMTFAGDAAAVDSYIKPYTKPFVKPTTTVPTDSLLAMYAPTLVNKAGTVMPPSTTPPASSSPPATTAGATGQPAPPATDQPAVPPSVSVIGSSMYNQTGQGQMTAVQTNGDHIKAANEW